MGLEQDRKGALCLQGRSVPLPADSPWGLRRPGRLGVVAILKLLCDCWQFRLAQNEQFWCSFQPPWGLGMLKSPWFQPKQHFTRDLAVAQPRPPHGLITKCSHLIVCDRPNPVRNLLVAWKSCQNLLSSSGQRHSETPLGPTFFRHVQLRCKPSGEKARVTRKVGVGWGDLESRAPFLASPVENHRFASPCSIIHEGQLMDPGFRLVRTVASCHGGGRNLPFLGDAVPLGWEIAMSWITAIVLWEGRFHCVHCGVCVYVCVRWREREGEWEMGRESELWCGLLQFLT